MSLHVHSEYSSLDGWSTVDEIAERMLEIKCPFCGLTDHGVVAGHIEFDKAMRSRGLNPVFGAELYHGVKFDDLKKNERDQAHLIALAMTDEGLRNLWRLTNATSDRDHFHHVGRVTNDDIVKYKEGIIFTSACPLGLVPQGLLKGDSTMLNWYLDNLGDNFRMEITTYPGDVEWRDSDSEDDEDVIVTPRLINELVVDAAQERGVKITYGDDGHYARPDQYEEHDMYIAAQTRQSIYTPVEDRKMWHPPGALCIKDEKTVRENLGYLPESVVDEAIANTYEIGEAADAHLPDVGKAHMPLFVPGDCPWLDDPEEDVAALFTRLVSEGIERIYAGTEHEAEAVEKAIHEMEVLMEDHLEHYFLLAWDVIQFCKMEGINVGPGRGSSAGAIVAYALGITDVDPLHYDLYFERFWNKGRTDGFPDIDTDFAKSRRGEILDYLIDRIGYERVCSIGTITRMKPVAVIEKLAMACEIDHVEMEQLKKIVKQTKDIEIHGHEQIGWSPEFEPDKVIYVNSSTEMNPEGDKVGEEIDEWIGFDQHQARSKRAKFVAMCEHACSRNSNYGIHASGIVVADIDLSDYAPAYRRGGKDGIPATQFPMSTVEKRMLLKLDVLGLKTLDTLAEWDKLMKAKGVETEWSGLDLQDHPEEMWDLLEEGFVSGVFQVETPLGKKLAEKLKPRSIEELAVLGSLNRPGPQRDGVPNRYIARMEGRSEITYPHPMLEQILKPTYGLFVYQEQIIRFMGALGYSLGDADAVRKILGKKHPEKLSEIFDGFNEWDKKGFLAVAMEKGFTKESATEVWKGIEGFASYSFNKSHAVAYAIIGFRCLYAKYYGPQEFYIACIRTVDKQKRAELTPEYIKEARRAGIKVLPPDIRYSQAQVDVHDGNIYFGFGDVKGVGTSGEYLVTLRDEEQFEIESPDEFEEMLKCYNDIELARKKQAQAKGEPFPATWKSPKQLLNEKKLSLIHAAGAWDELEETAVDLKTKQKCELELLSVILTDNTEEILADHEEELEQCSSWDQAVMSWEDKEDDPDQHIDWTYEDTGEEVPMAKRYRDYRLPGIITGVKPTKVRATGKAMGIITIEHGRHELSFACFSNKWPSNKFMFKPHNVGIFTIRQSAPTDKRGDGYHFEAGRLLT
jgi:DNA polymerase-3 subunit alpha